MKDFFSLLIFLILIGVPNISYANVAPVKIPGQTLVPLEQNVMRMATTDHIEMTSEEVLIDISILDKIIHEGGTATDSYLRSRSQASVTASFQLKNTSEDEINNFFVGFPFGAGGYTHADDQKAEWTQLRNLHVYIDGSEVAFEKKFYHTTNESSPDPESEPWAVWTMDFGKFGSELAVREIKLSYDILSSDWYFTELASIENLPEGIYDSAAFYYILHTGSGWKDTIGQTDVKMRFPKNIEFVQREFETWGGDANARSWSISPAGYTVDEEKHEITWEMNDWEPEFSSDANPNILVEFMYPETVKIFTDHFPIVSTAELTSSVNDPEKKETVQDVSSNESLSTLWIVSSGTVVLVVFGVVATVRKSKKK